MPLRSVPEAFSHPLHASTSLGDHGDLERRIADSLSVVAGFLHLQAASLGALRDPMNTEEACGILEQVGPRIDAVIDAVARLRRMLAQGDSKVELWGYLRDICAAAVSCGARRGVMELGFAAGPGCRVGPDGALSVGFIIRELVTNSARHAHPTGVAGQVHVDCSHAADRSIAITVSDDGVGLPEGFDPRRSGHLGMRVVRSLADQLAARLTFDSCELGLSVLLQVPAEGSPPPAPSGCPAVSG